MPCRGLPALDVPVPQMVENVTDTLLRILDFPIAEQVIEVPKISCSPCPSRSRVPEPQLAEQLVEVPTVLSPMRIALLIAEQIVDAPVPRGRDQGFPPRTEFNNVALFWQNAFLSGLWSRSSISQSRLSIRLLTLLLVRALDRGLPHLLVLQILGFFALFPAGKKCACRRESECGSASALELMDAGGL